MKTKGSSCRVDHRGFRAESNGESEVDTPHPGCFAKRVWNCLITKELSFSRMLKSPQSLETARVRSVQPGDKKLKLEIG
jgi:hypothetical protein